MHAVTEKTISLPSFTLSEGGESGELEISCCLWGEVSKPLVVVMGGISANRWALDSMGHSSAHGQSGWWRSVLNPASYLNPRDFSFLTFEYFAFADRVANPPLVSTMDQAHILAQLQQSLNLPQFCAVIGSSYGGMVSLAFAAQYPDQLQHLVCLAAADRNSVKSQALRAIQRQIMQLGLDAGGSCQQQYTALARSLAMLGYRSDAELEARFHDDDPDTSLQQVMAYLNHHGQRFAQTFSASRFAQLSRSIDHHSVDVSGISASSLLIGITTDQLVPVEFIQNMQLNINGPCQCQWLDSHYGHDGFLLEAEAINQIFKHYFSEYNHDHIKPNHRRASGY